MIRSYTELQRRDEFEDRYRYLALHGDVGGATFGYDRYINQKFYSSREWRHVRNFVITRDLGCDLGVDGYEIHSGILIHHMNPMDADDIKHGETSILEPEFLITTTHRTHNAIHYGNEKLLPKVHVPRSRNDTKLW
jgi:hypothetical protein